MSENTKRKLKAVTISIPPEQAEAMDNIHWDLRKETADLYRDAVTEFLAKHAPKSSSK